MNLKLATPYWAFLKEKKLHFSYQIQHLLAALLICLSLLLFFSTPVLNPAETYGSDILSAVPLLAPAQFPPGYVIKNNEISDSVTFFHPFLRFYRDQLSRGNFPLWNPYIGTGAPAFGNSSSGLLALPNLAFYLLPSWRLALVVSAFIKLFLSGFFSYLFMRQLKLNFGPALVGAVGFMYCGFNIFWLANSAPAVTPTLPLALYCIEKVLQSEKLANRLGWGSAISVSLALGIFAGHAETFFYISLFLAFYCLVRVLMLYGNWKVRFVRLVQLAAFGIAGILLAAIQLLPFLEYFQRSQAYQARTDFKSAFMPSPFWLLNVFPNIFGNTTDSFSAWNSLIQRNPAFIMIEANGAYVGWLGLFLALLALFYLRHYPLAGLFIGIALVVYAYLYNFFGLAELLHRLPLLNQAENNRSQPLIAFCIAVSAAFGLQGLSSHKLNWRWLTGLIAAGSGLLALVTLLAARAWEFAQIDQNSPQFMNYMSGQMSYILVSSGLGLLGLALLAYRRSPAWIRPAGLVLVALMVFAQSGWLFHDYNPTVPDDLYLPQPARIQMLQKQVGENYLVSLEDIALPPDVNTTYRLRTASIYDALGSRTYYKLFRTLGGVTPQPYYPKKFDFYLAKLLGMNYVVTTTNLDTSTNEFKLAGSETGVNLYQYLGSPGRYWTVGQAVSVANQDKALEVLAGWRDDPTKTVVLEQTALSGLTGESGSVEVVSDKPGEVILRLKRQSKGYLVAAISNFPGWQARLNGQEIALLRANYNFMAVPVPEGSSEIKLYYDPFSFKLGLTVSLLTLLGLLAVYLVARLRPKKAGAVENMAQAEVFRLK